MVAFIVGALVGILGFLAVASEDQPEPPKPDPRAWYMEDDGK